MCINITGSIISQIHYVNGTHLQVFLFQQCVFALALDGVAIEQPCELWGGVSNHLAVEVSLLTFLHLLDVNGGSYQTCSLYTLWS